MAEIKAQSQANGRLDRLGPEELDHVTLAGTVDASELVPPEVQYLIEQAETSEREFLSTAWGKGADDLPAPSQEGEIADGHEQAPWVDADHVSMGVTLDASDLSSDETASLLQATDEHERRLATVSSDLKRPDECVCWNADETLPCFPCYRAGFETQSPMADRD